MYQIMQTLTMTYKLTKDDINNKYYIIEIITSKNPNKTWVLKHVIIFCDFFFIFLCLNFFDFIVLKLFVLDELC